MLAKESRTLDIGHTVSWRYHKNSLS